jgi:competence protein ComEC
VLDVGQGLAVVLESPNKLLVYDSGPAYGEQFNAGSGIVAPFLRRRGRSSIDKLLISHGDADHVGGFYGLIDTVETKEAMLAPGFFRDYQAGANSTIRVEQCVKPRRWSWRYFNPDRRRYESIYFDVLLPNSESPSQEIPSGNNYSCVLLVRWRNQSILLAGDIERAAEKRLLKRYKLAPVTVMVAPHHGSKTSSSWQFVTQLKPLHVVFSAGFRHQYGHPHPQVVQRYKDLGTTVWNTADQGGITFIWDHNAKIETVTARATPPLYWWR